MKYFLQFNIKSISITIALFPLVICYPQRVQDNNKETEIRPGRYVPELHGASLGKWMPDYRGLYQHMKVPYNGGYGDSGVKYEHDVRNDVRNDVFQQKNPNIPFALGSQDHLRFMIDFNYNGTGWQIIKFEWLRDGEDERQYKYVNVNKLWETQDIQTTEQQSVEGSEVGYDYEMPVPDVTAASVAAAEPSLDTEPEVSTDEVEGSSNVHVDGEYDSNIYNVTYTEENQQPTSNDPHLKASIQEVLNYILNHIIPTLR